MELCQSRTVGKTVIAVKEDNKKVNLEEVTDVVYFAKKYKPVLRHTNV